MATVCLYFQVHQPRRLRRYSIFDVGLSHDYEDEALNRRILERVAAKCYVPANRLLLSLIAAHEGRLRLAFCLSGVLLDQLERYRPDVLEGFQALAKTGCVEFLNETYCHSLAYLFSAGEFREQVDLHRRRMEELFGLPGRTFRHTELIYSNDLAAVAQEMGYEAILAEGTDRLLGRRSPNRLYRPKGAEIKLILRNFRLSDDIAFRFSDRSWPEHPLDAAKFAHWLHELGDREALIGLFMDYETFGEHQWPETGILEFLAALPGEVFRREDFRFLTPAEAAACHEPAGEIDCPAFVSWADQERDLTAWLGNAMQQDALRTLYGLERAVKAKGDEGILEKWRMLQTSDHLYYMCTKWFADGDVHRYFNPYESPYEAYINYMNILDDLAQTVNYEKGERHGRHGQALPL